MCGRHGIEMNKLMIAPFGLGIATTSSKIRWGIIIERLIDMDKKREYLFHKNKEWLARKLNVRYGDLPVRHIKGSSRAIYKNNIYDLYNIHEVMALYNHITGKHEVLIDWRDYARILKERREKNDSKK